MSDGSIILQAIKETDACFDPTRQLWLICKMLYCGFFLKFGRITAFDCYFKQEKPPVLSFSISALSKDFALIK